MNVHPLRPDFLPAPDSPPVPCTADPEAFFSNEPDDVTAARALCAACPPERRTACANWAIEHREWGTWGGQTEVQRAACNHRPRAWRGLPGPASLKPCGTDAAYYRHIRRAETPCAACADAHRVAERDKARRRTRHHQPE